MRGDSGMSDSSFMKSHKIMQKKSQKSIDKFDQEYKIEAMRKRWESRKVEPTVWEKIVSWIRSFK